MLREVIMLGAVVLSPESLEPVITEIASKYTIEPALIKAVIKTESNWDVNASRFEAHKGDASWGLMQLMLATAKDVLKNPNLTTTQLIQPKVNIEAGTRLISQNLNRWGSLKNAVAAYNAGSPRLKSGTSEYVNQHYVDKVMKNYNVYKTLGTTAGNVVIAATETSMIPVYAGLGLLGLVLVLRED
jgi:soluble lytic murein transglycosylase-like protein